MTHEEYQNSIEKIASHYGYESQSRQLIEETAELTVAISKYMRFSENKEDTPSKHLDRDYYLFGIMEEIADVTIMIEQIKYLLSLNSDDIDLFIEKKLNRQLKRIGVDERK